MISTKSISRNTDNNNSNIAPNNIIQDKDINIDGNGNSNIENKNLSSTNKITYTKLLTIVQYTENSNKSKLLTINTWKDFNIHMHNLSVEAIKARDGCPVAITQKAKNAIKNMHIEYIMQMRLMFSKIHPDNLSDLDIKKYRDICQEAIKYKTNVTLELMQNPINLGSYSVGISYSKSEYEFYTWYSNSLSQLVLDIEDKFPILTTKKILERKPHLLELSADQLINTGLIQPQALTIEEVIKSLR